MDHERYVVVAKRSSDNALVVAFEEPGAPGLFQSEVRVHSLSWLGREPESGRPLEGRVRYRDPRVALRLTGLGDGQALVGFESPQRALAPGQVLALYDGPRLLGGAVYA
jgi:tRNA-specific 2-thiouridylase